MSTKHDEFSVEIPEADMLVSFVVNAPIVTCEITQYGAPQKILSWGMAYCRPTDTWNEEVGVKLATVSAVKKLVPEGQNPKNGIKFMMFMLEPALADIHEKVKEERRKERKELDRIISQLCGDCRACFR